MTVTAFSENGSSRGLLQVRGDIWPSRWCSSTAVTSRVSLTSSSPSSPEGSPLVPGSLKDSLAEPDQLVVRVVVMWYSCRAVLPDAPADIIIT